MPVGRCEMGGIMKTKGVFCLATAVAFMALSALIPAPEGLSSEGMRGLGVLAATILLMVTEALPLPIVMLSMMSALYLLGVSSFGAICSSFGNSAVLFMLASFGISTALANTHIPQAFVEHVIEWSRGSARRLCGGFLAGAAITSSFISDVPTCVIFGTFAQKLLQAAGCDEPGRSALGRSLMIAVPAGAIIGGFATPAGNGLNIMVLNAANEMADANLTFVKWCAAGIPLMAVISAICIFVLLRVFKPCDVDASAIRTMARDSAGSTTLGAAEAKFAAILIAMIFFWVASSWIPQINITVVSILGVLAMHLPGIGLLRGKDFVQGVSWESFMMCGGVIAVGTAVQGTGAISWIVDCALSATSSWSVLAVLLVFSLIPCLIHLATPVAGAIYALSCAPLITAAMALGMDPCVAALLVGLWVCVAFMQPFDLVYLLTYSYGYYTPKDLVTFGVVPTVALLALSVVWIPFVCAVM